MTAPVGFQVLSQHDDFISRHIGPSETDIQQMLASLKTASLDQLIADTVPGNILLNTALDLPGPRSETEVLNELHAMAGKNRLLRSLIGMGYADTLTPTVIQRNVLENPGWYTAYTPYQPEVSQGRLEALLNFQQMVMDLTALDIANASLLDEGSAAAEAMTLCRRASKQTSNTFFVADDVHPQTLAVVQTRAHYLGIDVVTGPATEAAQHDTFGVLLQYPGSFGDVHDFKPLIAELKARGSLSVLACDILALLLLTPPGELGADIAIGNTQRFGVPMGFGGPHAAYLATRDAHKRSMPGRLIGVSIDRRGKPALRMAMQTREQHIRREKATSNICTAQALLAIMASCYAVYHGPERLRHIALRVHRLTALLADNLEAAGFARRNTHFFDTLTLDVGSRQSVLLQAAEQAGFNLRPVDDSAVGISLDERSTLAEVSMLLAVFGVNIDATALAKQDAEASSNTPGLPPHLLRQSGYLSHPVFNSHHSETAMLRYLKKLEDRDVALNRSMIALGSCTMKLNATTEMLPITWPAFANLHPFAPIEQAEGYRELIRSLEQQLVACTGYDSVSLQPNAGSQGEYAGLLAIRRYHESRGETQRDICLIPSSAHGTNPASAALVGLSVVIVACDASGNVDLADLKTKAAQHSDRLAAIMITYPSTHGVFEEGVTEVCRIVHDNGGQVYVDGANMNALVGIAAPGKFGADVSHLNLHKTFCIPHGGGGPGMGPIAVRAHLTPFLCDHPVQTDKRRNGALDTVSSATWGSASILPISWTYIRLMGANGLRRATEIAILNANYIAERLQAHYPVLYTGRNGRVAHECIIDIRPLKAATGISEEDIAKRLIDFGFHAPTMSFPVPGTLMIEPTESESKAEIDRFCDALIRIREEITRVEQGHWPADNNPLVNAPHTQADLVGDWPHPYSREEAVFPLPWIREHKYWPAVNRVDNVHGDRNLFCACPPIESYQN